jgi:hypothetical protein
MLPLDLQQILGVIFIKTASFFNDNILIKVLLRPLKCMTKFFRDSVGNPWVRYCVNEKEMVKKKRVREARSLLNPWVE